MRSKNRNPAFVLETMNPAVAAPFAANPLCAICKIIRSRYRAVADTPGERALGSLTMDYARRLEA
jgi:hypothetical protein